MTTNKGYADQLISYTRAFEQNTRESQLRKSYPGPDAPPPCDDAECVNRREELAATACITYSLCDACRKACPSSLKFFKQAPSPLVIPPKKQRRADAAVFSAHCSRRAARRQKPDPLSEIARPCDVTVTPTTAKSPEAAAAS